jgi:hypothetical protein
MLFNKSTGNPAITPSEQEPSFYGSKLCQLVVGSSEPVVQQWSNSSAGRGKIGLKPPEVAVYNFDKDCTLRKKMQFLLLGAGPKNSNGWPIDNWSRALLFEQKTPGWFNVTRPLKKNVAFSKVDPEKLLRSIEQVDPTPLEAFSLHFPGDPLATKTVEIPSKRLSAMLTRVLVEIVKEKRRSGVTEEEEKTLFNLAQSFRNSVDDILERGDTITQEQVATLAVQFGQAFEDTGLDEAEPFAYAFDLLHGSFRDQVAALGVAPLDFDNGSREINGHILTTVRMSSILCSNDSSPFMKDGEFVDTISQEMVSRAFAA